MTTLRKCNGIGRIEHSRARVVDVRVLELILGTVGITEPPVVVVFTGREFDGVLEVLLRFVEILRCIEQVRIRQREICRYEVWIDFDRAFQRAA